MRDLALRERDIMRRCRDAAEDPDQVCCICGTDMVVSKRMRIQGRPVRRRYCPLCLDGVEYFGINVR